MGEFAFTCLAILISIASVGAVFWSHGQNRSILLKNQTRVSGVEALVDVRKCTDEYGMSLGQFRTAGTDVAEASRFYPDHVFSVADIFRLYYYLRTSIDKLALVLSSSFPDEIIALRTSSLAVHSAFKKEPRSDNSVQFQAFKNKLTDLESKFLAACPTQGKIT